MKSRTLLAALIGGVMLIAGAVGAWTSASQGAAAPPGGNPNDPITAARFELSIDGHSLAVFSELEGIVSGFDRSELRVVTRRRGGAELRLPARRMPQTVTLRRGLTRNIELAAWHELVILGDVAAARKNVSLTMYDPSGDPVARYHLTNAWPSKLEIGGLKAGAGTVLLETVTLSAEFIQRVSI
jgi:phage tail-like protein